MANEQENSQPNLVNVVIPEFQPNSDEWVLYQERLENYFGAYDIKTEDKRKVTLLNSIGPKAYKLVRDMCDPDTPSTKSYTFLCKMLKDYYTQPIIAYKERKEFYNLSKAADESVVEWMARIKCCASNCDFGVRLKDIVLDKFVTGKYGKIRNINLCLTLARAFRLFHNNCL